VLGVAAAYFATVNTFLVVRTVGASRRGERRPSFLPMVTVLFGSMALVIAPLSQYRLLWIVAPILLECSLTAIAAWACRKGVRRE
jgi:hypothetical protein